MSRQANLSTGSRGEQIAALYLSRKGYQLLKRNYRTKWGEIDLLMQDQQVLVFVEVKTKKSDKYGEPYEMVTENKLAQIVRIAEGYLGEQDYRGPCRVDVVSIKLYDDKVPDIRHFVNLTG